MKALNKDGQDMKNIYLLFRTDEHLTTCSKELMFIGELHSCLEASLRYHATENQKTQLSIYGQSQSNNIGYEFMIEKYEWDKLNHSVYIVEPEI